MVQTVAAGFDIDAQEQALRRIEAAFAAARQHDLGEPDQSPPKRG